MWRTEIKALNELLSENEFFNEIHESKDLAMSFISSSFGRKIQDSERTEINEKTKI